MSSNESEDFEDPETEQTQVYQSDQDEMHFYQDEKVKENPETSERMEFQIVDRQMIINQLEAIKALESTIRNEVIEAQVSY